MFLPKTKPRAFLIPRPLRLALCLLALMPSSLWATVQIGCVKASTLAPPTKEDAKPGRGMVSLLTAQPKIAEAGSALILPFFVVDMADTAGITTLFAVRNLTEEPVEMVTTYFSQDGDLLKFEAAMLPALATATVNVRNEGPFPADPDGFARGFVGISANWQGGEPPPADADQLIAGDYFQITSAEDFASGDRLLRIDGGQLPSNDLCNLTESRFLNGGPFTGGSTFQIFTLANGGVDPMADPTLYATVYDEAGQKHEVCQIYTDQMSLQIPVSSLTELPFGTVELFFDNGIGVGGQVITEFDALGRFSVGMRGLCEAPPF